MSTNARITVNWWVIGYELTLKCDGAAFLAFQFHFSHYAYKESSYMRHACMESKLSSIILLVGGNAPFNSQWARLPLTQKVQSPKHFRVSKVRMLWWLAEKSLTDWQERQGPPEKEIQAAPCMLSGTPQGVQKAELLCLRRSSAWGAEYG